MSSPDTAASAVGIEQMADPYAGLKAETRPPWHQRSGTEWALRAGPTSTARVLMRRLCDGDGLDYEGHTVAWRDVATFSSYNDADEVLRVLQRHIR